MNITRKTIWIEAVPHILQNGSLIVTRRPVFIYACDEDIVNLQGVYKSSPCFISTRPKTCLQRYNLYVSIIRQSTQFVPHKYYEWGGILILYYRWIFSFFFVLFLIQWLHLLWYCGCIWLWTDQDDLNRTVW